MSVRTLALLCSACSLAWLPCRGDVVVSPDADLSFRGSRKHLQQQQLAEAIARSHPAEAAAEAHESYDNQQQQQQQQGAETPYEDDGGRQLATASKQKYNLCAANATACFANAVCRECLLVGATYAQADMLDKCGEAELAFKNAFDGTLSADRSLLCYPLDQTTLLGGYLECVWQSGPCRVTSGAGALRAGALAVAAAVVGIAWLF
eukprot:TRINITY_DN2239_c0_g1_i1.p1 TRINITY_DN2239_c0_g1~~TRINITY_DN2239_c0_g1_i1.p1  ORF type:complete len:206 (-),score=45.10 TRINITY_DN2239_c0_g1_i1:284-901(-)